MNTIIVIKIDNRAQESLKLQEILTNYGCYISTRIGLHKNGDYNCTNYGTVLLEVTDKVNEIYDELAKHWSTQLIKF